MKKYLAIVLSALLLAACATQETFKEARILIEAGNEEAGLARLEQALQESPQDVELRNYYERHKAVAVQRYLQLGDNARSAGQPERAEEAYRLAQRFDADNAALAFPAKWLEHRLSNADPNLRHEIKAWLEDRNQPDVADEVRRAVRTMLVDGNVSEEAVAKTLNVSRRTLIRRLEVEGIAFHTLVQELRLEVACQLLRSTNNPVADVAASLGYAGVSPFRRAFKRWTGETPTDWRRRNGPGSPRR